MFKKGKIELKGKICFGTSNNNNKKSTVFHAIQFHGILKCLVKAGLTITLPFFQRFKHTQWGCFLQVITIKLHSTTYDLE